MGFNYVMCGYGSVDEMVKDMCSGEDKQLEAFARFIKFAELLPIWSGKTVMVLPKDIMVPDMLRITTIKNWKRLIGDLRSRKKICPNGYRFLFRPRFYAMPGIKPGIFR